MLFAEIHFADWINKNGAVEVPAHMLAYGTDADMAKFDTVDDLICHICREQVNVFRNDWLVKVYKDDEIYASIFVYDIVQGHTIEGKHFKSVQYQINYSDRTAWVAGWYEEGNVQLHLTAKPE